MADIGPISDNEGGGGYGDEYRIATALAVAFVVAFYSSVIGLKTVRKKISPEVKAKQCTEFADLAAGRPED